MSELEIWNELGNIYYNTGAYDEAIRAYHKAIDLDHGCGQSYSNLASIYIHKEYYTEAILMFQKGIELLDDAKDKALLWNRLGDTYLRLDDYEDAIAVYQKAVELDPENAVLKNDLAKAELDSAHSLSEDNLASLKTLTEPEFNQEPPPSPEPSVAESAYLESKETITTEPGLIETETVPEASSILSDPSDRSEPETACWVFKAHEPASLVEEDENSSTEKLPLILGSRILSEMPIEDVTLGTMAQATESAGSEKGDATGTPDQNIAGILDSANPTDIENLDTLDRADKKLPVGQLKLDEPTNSRANALLQLGLLHWRRGDYERAIQFLKTALDLTTGFYDYHFEALCFNAIALVETDLGKTDKAIQAYESAASLDPEHIFPWNSLGSLYSQSDRHKEALVAFQKAIEHNPKDSASWNGLGDVYHKLGRNEDAIAAYQLGNVFDEPGCHADAITTHQMAFDTDLENPQILEEMGNINYDDGAYDDAINAYAKAIELLDGATDKARLWKRLGDAYQQLNEHDHAIAAYQKAVELDPHDAALQVTLARIASTSASFGSKSCVESPKPITDTNPESSQSLEPCDEEAALAESEESSAIESDSTETEHIGEVETVPEELPVISETVEDPEPEAAYWVFKASTPAGETPRPKARFRSSAEIAVGNIKPSPAFVMPQFTSQALLDNHLLTDTYHDATVIVVEQTPGTEEATKVEYVNPIIAQGDQDGPFSEADPEMIEPSRLEPANPVVPNPLAAMPVNRIADPIETNLHNLENDIAAYRRVTEINPKNDRAWDALGNMYEAIGLHSEAISAFEKAISLASQREVYYYHLGLAHAAQMHYDKAIQALQKVVALNPDYMLAHCALAGYYRKTGKEAEAKEHIAIARPYIENENEYNQACFESICENTDRAIAFLRTALDKQQIQLELVRSDPDLDFIRTDPRFEELILKNGNISQ
jgi:tetratricopeptide (TPR) repeat protein